MGLALFLQCYSRLHTTPDRLCACGRVRSSPEPGTRTFVWRKSVPPCVFGARHGDHSKAPHRMRRLIHGECSSSTRRSSKRFTRYGRSRMSIRLPAQGLHSGTMRLGLVASATAGKLYCQCLGSLASLKPVDGRLSASRAGIPGYERDSTRSVLAQARACFST